jgi:hypothetical protein
VTNLFFRITFVSVHSVRVIHTEKYYWTRSRLISLTGYEKMFSISGLIVLKVHTKILDNMKVKLLS